MFPPSPEPPLPGGLVCITGAAGFLGRVLVRRLRNLGVRVHCLDLQSGFDVTNWPQFLALPPFDAFIHLAARTFVPESFQRPRETLQINLVGTLNALEACRLTGAAFVFASTYVYGIPCRIPTDESHPRAAGNPYTESKILGERLCERYAADFAVDCTVLRAFNIYGDGQDPRFLIPSIIQQAIHGRILLKDPAPRRDFVHVEDVADAYVCALRHRQRGCHFFNVGSGVSYSVEQLANLVRDRIDPKMSVAYSSESRPAEIPETRAEISKARTILGWSPRIDIATGLDSCIAAQTAPQAQSFI